eukprot:3611886-Amphidinium_carterae.2
MAAVSFKNEVFWLLPQQSRAQLQHVLRNQCHESTKYQHGKPQVKLWEGTNWRHFAQHESYCVLGKHF